MKKLIMLLIAGFFLMSCAHGEYTRNRDTVSHGVGAAAVGSLASWALGASTAGIVAYGGASALVGGAYGYYQSKNREIEQARGRTDCEKITRRDYDSDGIVIRQTVKEVCSGKKSERTY